jgi:hypothetical protein
VTVVTVGWIISAKDVEALTVPAIPTTVTAVVVAGAEGETDKASTELAVPPAGGVSGFGPNPPVTPDGRDAVRVTGAEKPPLERMVTMTVPVPPGTITMLLGLADMLNSAVAVTVKVAEAVLPVLPVTVTV